MAKQRRRAEAVANTEQIGLGDGMHVAPFDGAKSCSLPEGGTSRPTTHAGKKCFVDFFGGSWHRYERSDRTLLGAPGLTTNGAIGHLEAQASQSDGSKRLHTPGPSRVNRNSAAVLGVFRLLPRDPHSLRQSACSLSTPPADRATSTCDDGHRYDMRLMLG